MKRVILLAVAWIMLSFAAPTVSAQTTSTGVDDLSKNAVKKEVVDVKPMEKPQPIQEEILVFTAVEQMPQFPGGDKALYQWIATHIIYPPMAAEEDIQGRVVVQFVVEQDGSISNVQVLRGKHPALDKEAVRVVRSMPKWAPGRNNGEPVRVTYTIPVTFKLSVN